MTPELNPESKALLENIYYLIGVFVFTGFSTIVAALVFVVKFAFNQGKERAEALARDMDAKDCAVRAHKRLDALDGGRDG